METTGNDCRNRRPPTNCCRHAVLRSNAMTVAIFYLIINISAIVGYAFYIIYCSVIFPTYEQHKLYFLSYIFAGVLVLAGINITFDSLLLNGIRNTKRKLILAWVIWYGIFDSLVSVAWLGGFIVWIYLAATSLSPTLALEIYFTCVHCLLGLVILPAVWFCYSRVTCHLATLTPGDDDALISKLVRQNTRFGLVNLPPQD